MSTTKEKLETIKQATEIARKRMDALKQLPILSREQQFELDMCENTVSLGESILSEDKEFL